MTVYDIKNDCNSKLRRGDGSTQNDDKGSIVENGYFKCKPICFEKE